MINSRSIKKYLYVAYYIKITAWPKLWSDIKFVSGKESKPFLNIFYDVIKESFRTGVSFQEYVYYQWYSKNKAERDEYITMSQIYEYQLEKNPKELREYVSNKKIFMKKYSEYIGREWYDLYDENILNRLSNELSNKGKVVLKNSNGRAGDSIKVVDLATLSINQLIRIIKKNNYDLLEEYVYQHREMSKLSPDSLNTIRVITYNNNNKIKIIGSIIRIGCGGETDNLTTGGIACQINQDTGIIDRSGISFDIKKSNITTHPVTGVKLIGFKIPYWEEILSICIRAAKKQPSLKSLGWDVAVTEKGPILIESNHDWGARLWQMSSGKGLKKYLYD